jgi:hypothetical protein
VLVVFFSAWTPPFSNVMLQEKPNMGYCLSLMHCFYSICYSYVKMLRNVLHYLLWSHIYEKYNISMFPLFLISCYHLSWNTLGTRFPLFLSWIGAYGSSFEWTRRAWWLCIVTSSSILKLYKRHAKSDLKRCHCAMPGWGRGGGGGGDDMSYRRQLCAVRARWCT